MSGFFVSNNLGTFSAEDKTPKVFNASMVGWGGGSSSGTLVEALRGGSSSDNWSGRGISMSHFFKKKGDNTKYSGTPSFSVFPTNDSIELKGGHDYGFNVSGTSDSQALFEITVPSACVLGGKGHISPTVMWNGDSTSLLTAANNSNFPHITAVGGSENKVRIELAKPSHYISLDPADEISGIGTFTVNTSTKDGKEYKFEKTGGKLSQKGVCGKNGYGTPISIKLISWTKIQKGCTDNQASNFDGKGATWVDDGSCQFDVAPIETFTVSKSNVTQGVSNNVVFNFKLGNSAGQRTSKTTLYASNSAGDNQKLKSWGKNVFSQNWSYNTNKLPVGLTTFKLVSEWNLNAGNPDSAQVSLTVDSPQTLRSCNDPNASKYRETSITGDCGSCKSGYYLGDDGLCTTCEDPNRDSDSNGRCTTCLSGYAEDTDGTCQKVGCMTYADGLSASDDYNYDPDAVVNDSTMCQGADPVEPDLVPEMIDCELSDWGDWSEFTEWSDAVTASGTRTRTRNRTIVTNVSGGGATCGELEETETETGELDPDTGEVTTVTTSTDDTTSVTPTTKPSPVIPIIIGVAALGALALLIRR